MEGEISDFKINLHSVVKSNSNKSSEKNQKYTSSVRDYGSQKGFWNKEDPSKM